MHEKYIEKIIQSNDDNKMYALRDVLTDMILYIQNTDKDTYNKIECDLYEISEGKTLSEEKAKQWVYNMNPKAKWTLSDIDNIINKYNITIPRIATYTIMNMLYSDFSDVLGKEINEQTLNNYIKMAEDWYYDDDPTHTEDEKLYYYYKYIVN